MMKSRTWFGGDYFVGAVLGAFVAFASSGASASTWVVSYEGEAAGMENTTATFSASGVETFDTLSTGFSTGPITATFGTAGTGGMITATYTGNGANGYLGGNIQINAADQYGGAGGTGNYIAAFAGTPYTLALTSTVQGGINYFGFWLSALDSGNYVTFYGSGGQKLFTFDPADAIAAVKASPNPSEYYGNPNPPYKGADSAEPFIFVNFFYTAGSFSTIMFSEDPKCNGCGYESDNHTFGHYLTMGSGTVIPLVDSVEAPAPTPGAGVLSLAFFAIVCFRSLAKVFLSSTSG